MNNIQLTDLGLEPTGQPSQAPTSQPSGMPSGQPTATPTTRAQLLINLVQNGAGSSLSGWSACTSTVPYPYQTTCTNGYSACGTSGVGWSTSSTLCPIGGKGSFYNTCGGTVYGFMQQPLNLTIGMRYLLSFNVKAHASGQTTRNTYVGIDNQLFFSMANNAFGTSTVRKTISFIATANNQVLYVSAVGDTGGTGNCK